jgi:hypothetical protein
MIRSKMIPLIPNRRNALLHRKLASNQSVLSRYKKCSNAIKCSAPLMRNEKLFKLPSVAHCSALFDPHTSFDSLNIPSGRTGVLLWLALFRP